MIKFGSGNGEYMNMRTDHAWLNPEFARQYLDDVCGAIPFEREQFDIAARLMRKKTGEVKRFLDMGCGNGVLSSMVLKHYPESQGVLLDFSGSMLKTAREKLSAYAAQLFFINADFGDKNWVDMLPSGTDKEFDVVVSRFSIHHQPDGRKRELFAEIYNMLSDKGIFINIEHVAASSVWGKSIFQEYMIDCLYHSHLKGGGKRTKSDIADEFRLRHEKDADVIAPVEKQCEWLRETGFIDVDCYFKILEIAIFAGRRK